MYIVPQQEGPPYTSGMPPRTAFPGYDEPVNLEGDPEELLSTLLEPEQKADTIEPELDE